jgi:polar amino acid transport system permease protein
MSRDIAVVWQHRDVLMEGLLRTVLLTIITTIAALALGAILAAMMQSRFRLLFRIVQIFVDTMRCIPFLLFAYLLYYGLPAFGIRMSSWSTGLFALIVYASAYMAEIFRAAWAELPRDGIEAGQAFGFSHFNLFRHIILAPLLFATAPLIGNQVIQIIKDSAFLMVITVPELTYAATYIQSTYFTPFAAFVAALLLYWSLTMLVETAIALIDRRAAISR